MKKSKFNLSHNASLTADMGYLVPFLCLDCLPNDTHFISVQSFVRAQPMLAPLMHQVNLYSQYWFVPYRILWNEWTDFITGGLSGIDTPEFPTIDLSKDARKSGSLADYFGIPPAIAEENLKVSALPFRAYAEIWNTRYRDEDLQNEVSVSYNSGNDNSTNTQILRPAWAKDYFTTSRPFTQRGSQISVPVNSYNSDTPQKLQGNIVWFSKSSNLYSSNPNNVIPASPYECDAVPVSVKIDASLFSDGWNVYGNELEVSFNGFTASFKGSSPVSAVANSSKFGSKIQLVYKCSMRGRAQTMNFNFSSGGLISLKLSGLTSTEKNLSSNVTLSYNVPVEVVLNYGSVVTSSVNIRDLRLSSALQRYQERSLEYGNRYEEFIQREFGIKPQDARIQRPEYLGGGKSFLRISEVLQTAEGTDSGVGTMRGHGVSALANRRIRFRCPEHGVLIGLLSIRPHSVYTQGLARQWTKFSKLDYFVPELANIGMQEVFASEIYANGSNSDKVFGYQRRYDEYRKLPNRISGEFRNILDFWNLARKFDAEPALNADFIEMKPSKRIFAEQTQNSFLIMLRNNIKSYRPIPRRAKNILM